VRLYSRRGAEWTARLPSLVEQLAGIACRSAIIDAELVLPGAGGVPDLERLHLRMRRDQHALLEAGPRIAFRAAKELKEAI
jgi:bifunctional non-homologous end joining protein LigD